MKTSLILAVLICLTAGEALGQSIVRQRLAIMQENDRIAAMNAWNASAPQRIAAERSAQWIKDNPWYMSPVWRDLTNRISQMEVLISHNQNEAMLLSAAGQANGARGKQVDMWIRNEQTALINLRKQLAEYQASWRLKEYYRTNSLTK